jgi:hydrogenase-1 operon protein HyaF
VDVLSGAVDPGARAAAVLIEVADALTALGRDPLAERTIDLHGLPLDDAERAWLRERLGDGEVRATLEVAGRTAVDETAYAGVWWLRHGDAAGRVLFEQIVVARVPALLLAHPQDAAAAAGRLAAAVAETEVTHDD